MDSQGDAGQFRTPRHIIDFIVEIVDPKKNETVLDPACGTAGFLISSYRHILKTNTKDRNGDILTPNEKKRLLNNFTGYDISPDMVRLSLVNMYLHGFSDPKITEYDTLTSEERWNETSDVVLANPPFMTPKGGIRPHKRFSIQAKRSEVLFVDYIAEHLNPNGRAGVIVPEGIIFQSQTAYKNLRKMLVENYLWAVVSLPAGVFQPYSGVKTSVLLIDKTLSKKINKILFVKITSDGFDLGAQRRKIDKNDLPTALAFITAYKQAVMNGREVDDADFAHAVEKSKIAESVDWNLSGERYRDSGDLRIANYELVELGKVAEVISGQSPEGKYYNQNGKGTPFYQGKTEFTDMNIGEPKKWTTKVTKKAYRDDILMSVRAPVGPINFATQEICIGRGLAAIRPSEKINKLFLFYFLRSIQDRIKGGGGAVFDSINHKQIQSIKTPLPPLDVQKAIVAEIDGYQKIIDGARQVVDNYKPTIKIDPDWEMVKLGEICQIKPPKTEVKDLDSNLDVSFVPMSDLNEKQINFEAKEMRKIGDVIKGYTYFRDHDVLLAKITPCFENGKSGIARNLLNGIGFGSTEFIVFRPNEGILSEWIYCFVSEESFFKIGKNNMTGSAGQQRVPSDFMQNYQIPLPPLSIQQEIVAQIEAEQEMVNGNKKLIEIYEQKIKDKINEVWGE